MNNEQIKEINQHISDALQQWANITLTADADNWSYYLDYNENDVLNAMFIVTHVCSNVAIKSGHIKDAEDAFKKGNKFRESVLEFFGLDMHHLVKEQMCEEMEKQRKV